MQNKSPLKRAIFAFFEVKKNIILSDFLEQIPRLSRLSLSDMEEFQVRVLGDGSKKIHIMFSIKIY